MWYKLTRVTFHFIDIMTRHLLVMVSCSMHEGGNLLVSDRIPRCTGVRRVAKGPGNCCFQGHRCIQRQLMQTWAVDRGNERVDLNRLVLIRPNADILDCESSQSSEPNKKPKGKAKKRRVRNCDFVVRNDSFGPQLCHPKVGGDMDA